MTNIGACRGLGHISTNTWQRALKNCYSYLPKILDVVSAQTRFYNARVKSCWKDLSAAAESEYHKKRGKVLQQLVVNNVTLCTHTSLVGWLKEDQFYKRVGWLAKRENAETWYVLVRTKLNEMSTYLWVCFNCQIQKQCLNSFIHCNGCDLTTFSWIKNWQIDLQDW